MVDDGQVGHDRGRTRFPFSCPDYTNSPDEPKDSSVSLWTPDGERPVSRTASTAAEPSPPGITPELRSALAESGIDVDQLTPEQIAEATAMLAEMSRVRADMLSVPAAEVIANHLMGIYELAAIHLGENPPNFVEATVAIEALRAVLDRLGTEFGENEAVLRQALSQLQVTFVALKEQVAGADGAPEPGVAAND